MDKINFESGANKQEGNQENNEQIRLNKISLWHESLTAERYASERARIAQEELYSHEERIELLRESDVNWARKILSDDKLYSEYESGLNYSSIEAGISKEIKNLLLKTFRTGEFYSIPCNSELCIPDRYSVLGISGKVIFDDSQITDDGLRNYIFSIEQEATKGYGKVEYVGVLLVDVDQKDPDLAVRVVISTEGIGLDEDNHYRKYEGSTVKLIALPVLALERFVKIPKITHVPYEDGRVNEAEKGDEENSPTMIYDEIESTLLFRRRTFSPGDESAIILKNIEDLIRSYSAEDAEILKEFNNGEIGLKLYAKRNYKEEGQEKITTRYDSPITLPYGDQSLALETISEALQSGAGSIVVTVCGARIPRELENLPPGTSKKPHFRRIREGGEDAKTIIVFPVDAPTEIKEIGLKIRAGEDISDTELIDIMEHTNYSAEEILDAINKNRKAEDVIRRREEKKIVSPDGKEISEKQPVDKNKRHTYEVSY